MTINSSSIISYIHSISLPILLYTYIYLSCYTRRIIRRLQTDRNDLYVEMHILSDCESLWCTARQSRLERSGDSQSRIQKERWCLFLSSLQAHPSCICRPCLMLFLILADQRDKWISFGFSSWMFWRGDAQKNKKQNRNEGINAPQSVDSLTLNLFRSSIL